MTWSLLTSFNGFYQERERGKWGGKKGRKESGGEGGHKYLKNVQRRSMSTLKVTEKVDLVGIIVKKLETLRENRVLCPRAIGKLP